jgi:hypothetical protein
MTSTATTHLKLIVHHWDDLTTALAAPNTSTWPPSGLRHHLHRTNDAEEHAYRTAHRYLDRSPEQIGATAAPIRLGIIDTMRKVETDLRYCADTLAAEIQRPPMAKAPTHWLPADRARRDQLAEADRTDPRRWNWRGTPRSAPLTAAWLLGRLDGRGGPFLPLAPRHREQIGKAAEAGAQAIEEALELARHSTPVDRPCPHCRGSLVVLGGDGEDPVVECRDCGRKWMPGLGAA